MGKGDAVVIVHPTNDFDMIRRFMTHPRVWPHISDDGCPDSAQFEPLREGVLYLAVRNEPNILGIFLYHPHNSIMAEVHTCMNPMHWGSSVEAGRATLGWVFDNTNWQKIITHVAETNRLALKLARDVGMTVEGNNRASFLKDGVLLDQYLLGITKEELCQQQQ
ncbi:MAG: GNAT family N-acetyltransferase [Pikeienuella sp.]